MAKMKAAVLTEPGNVELQEVEIPEIGEDDVLVKVAYIGLCGSDLPRTQAENGARMYPLIVGHEFSGTVSKVGKNVTDLEVGQKCAVAPLIPDPSSIYTQEALYGLSDPYNIIGTGSNGALAEFVKVPKRHIVKLPDNVNLLEGAGVEPAAVAFHGIFKSGLQVADSVAILGCGSIGQLAVQCAVAAGATDVIAVDIFDEKLEMAKNLGATHTINSKDCDLVEEIKKITEHGVYRVVETAGSPITQEQSIQIARKNATIAFVGISGKALEISAESMNKMMRGEIKITGCWNSYSAPYPGRAWKAVVDFMEKGQIKFEPIVSHHITLDEVGEYLSGMYNREIPYNKVVVDIHPE
ncbi:galactitol-1-phosphate 5-dehydrogenase [Aerococcus loyolae]|uniref:Galactitol-1-phosphate 5-dehydrogenase n=1 Tax=Aerococcus loyolae TaxID=2976809 RepID=A0ABT4C189_9LACT|nr:galactitol-1-phosphate 5-dehydrogenase [Aerococcus loyolae]MCY3025281.1 galactitol-1-phosphate 5-dehydrogenase [Aerococcus loyolae]MCY3029182.1 galactitol-1-phosphate 5-dehydrogenase [Aerococcus loyolae]